MTYDVTSHDVFFFPKWMVQDWGNAEKTLLLFVGNRKLLFQRLCIYNFSQSSQLFHNRVFLKFLQHFTKTLLRREKENY